MREDNNSNIIDICVIGAGHAGCEAALAAARLGLEVILFTISVDSIALMPCNPNIGGTSKGHLVREIDALGGEMGKVIDKTYIQSKMLNLSKGPAVHSLRAQADKHLYSMTMREILQKEPNITIKQSEVCSILRDGDRVVGVGTYNGRLYYSKSVIVCTGTYMKSRCLCGEAITYTGPNGLASANSISQSLSDIGIMIKRYKTGTPARIDGSTIDYDKMLIQDGDEKVVPFSYSNLDKDISKAQVHCYLTYTNEDTHRIINDNIHRSPMYSGVIEGTGPRYCPSIEDKIVKFADKDRHQIFIEPEGLTTNEMYIAGMSTSLPEDVQIDMYRSIKGLEHCNIVRNGYAIEYDVIDATSLSHTLEVKSIRGLFTAGQINGSSGYEEAAAQGLVAGINASLMIKGKDLITIDRSEGYIGVLIDDLVTKESNEPYRMMTARAEYRLLLRQDNADLRLREKGYIVGLISQVEYDRLLYKKESIYNEIHRLKRVKVGATKAIQSYLVKMGSTPLKSGAALAELLCRPELNYYGLAPIDEDRPVLDDDIIQQVCIEIKYEGYISRQLTQVAKFKSLEGRTIPSNIDYSNVGNLRLEARDKLDKFRPKTIGQASRISGVTPADIAILSVYIETSKRKITN